MEVGVGEADGNMARKFMAEAIDFHPSKDVLNWYIRTQVAVTGGWDFIDTAINPKISPLSDKEGQLHGQAVQEGDLKITVNGSAAIDTATILVTKNVSGSVVEEWDVFNVQTEKYSGVSTELRCFVRPKNKEFE